MDHKINRQSMINDIILTVALILSLSITNAIAFFIDLHSRENKFIIFSVLSYFLIKILYNSIIAIVRRRHESKK